MALPFLIKRFAAAGLLSLVCVCFCVAGDEPAAPSAEEPGPAAKKLEISYEVEADYSYVGAARTESGGHHTGNVTEQSGSLRVIMAPRWGEGPIFRFGFAVQRFSFGLPGKAPLP